MNHLYQRGQGLVEYAHYRHHHPGPFWLFSGKYVQLRDCQLMSLPVTATDR